MRIALVAQQASPRDLGAGFQSAGQAVRVSSLSRSLARLGHRVTIYARRDSARRPASLIVEPGVIVEQVAAGPPVPFRRDEVRHVGEFGGALSEHWRRNPPDVVHAHFWTSGLAALAGARDLGLPVIQTFDSLGAAEQRRGRLTGQAPAARVRMEACIARTVGAVLASSSEEVSELARLGVPKASVSVVPCGVDTVQFHPYGPVAQRSERPRLVAAGPLARQRGLDTVVHALANLPEAELVIVGAPARAWLRADQGYRDLAQLCGCLGLADRVAFTGRVGPGGLAALLRSADLLVSMAPYEPIGMVVIQAMACGTPVVASAVGSHQDTVVDGMTGVLIPPGRPDLLAQRLRRLLAGPLRLAAFGMAAADRARACYSWDRISRETLAAYESSRQRQVGMAGRLMTAAPCGTR